jgi:hypothetical protein
MGMLICAKLSVVFTPEEDAMADSEFYSESPELLQDITLLEHDPMQPVFAFAIWSLRCAQQPDYGFQVYHHVMKNLHQFVELSCAPATR